MARRKRGKAEETDLDMTPMLDIVFIMLIFFIVTASFVKEAGIGSMELHTWIAATAAHLAAGGKNPQTDFYSVAPELGIAAGIVHAT